MIDKLQFFITLAGEQHFGRAAEECGVTQPTLSAAIRQLENELGVMLVNRGSRYQGLTPEGQRVLEWARRIVGDARTMKEEMRAARSGLSGHVRIAAIPTALSLIPKITAPFQEKHPDVTFSIQSATSLQILGQLENLETDIGITYLENEPLGRMVAVPLIEERYHLVVARTAAEAKLPSIAWREASTLPLCLLTSDMQNRRIINRHMGEAGVTIAPRLESNSMIVLFTHVLTGKWASIMPLEAARSFGFADDVAVIPLMEPEASHSVGVVALERDPNTPLVSALINAARNVR
ncbi:LysR family transcriptional regulator [Rhizobium sp. KVB221]|uniref:HTH-type transcriptional regulator TtuA n=1 Tax=Rhizobium setariae TaxID=2801340 RepID=A0A936YQI2_9HYPH|nr:LysR family transcriptional regulator [Rhizobium setariae]MBL0374954.1 LysR family transcriptional regulator [Rhizobium setariae]